jgi:hypothetical protein
MQLQMFIPTALFDRLSLNFVRNYKSVDILYFHALRYSLAL